ncbi:MAG: hypothetical protein M3Y08_02040 [Fibrobacterota bacterium]|nr:hypothetical protein [Fibrobacterota bacterium]
MTRLGTIPHATSSPAAPAESGFTFPTSLLSWVTLAVWAALFMGCGSSTETMQKKLEAIAAEDLKDIIKEVPDKARKVILAKPYYKIDHYQEFHGDTAIVFQANASVIFFYLDPSLNLCQTRKYRYRRTSAIWDRYEVKLIHFPKKYSGIETQ